jgi:photosystem II stability/assembly factor-like uncharacterized protein
MKVVTPLVGWYSSYIPPYGLYKTTDGGYTWTGCANMPVIGGVINFYGEWRGFYAEGRNAAVTFDGGETWTVYTHPAGIHVEGAVYLDSLTMIGTSNRFWGEDSTLRQVARSTDGGLTWTSLFTEICMCGFSDPCMSSGGTILVVGVGANEVWRSTNRGDSWQVVGTDISTHFSDVAASDSGIFFRTVFGASAGPPAIARSCDDGFTWQVVWTGDSSLPRQFELMDVQFSDPLHGWVCGDDGLVVQTTDGGDTWTSYYLPEASFGLSAMSFLDSTLGWGIDPGGGSSTKVYRWSTVNNVSGGWQGRLVADRLEIAAVYPNPFNSSTTIRSILSRGGPVEVCIYDINGRLVNRLARGFSPAGEHALTFDGRGLASGVYVCQLKAGSLTDTQKMVLIR